MMSLTFIPMFDEGGLRTLKSQDECVSPLLLLLFLKVALADNLFLIFITKLFHTIYFDYHFPLP